MAVEMLQVQYFFNSPVYQNNRRNIVRNHNMLGSADITKCNICRAPLNYGFHESNG